jgi:predicted SnoaL-like aldol condensation-catalyzing enzyme
MYCLQKARTVNPTHAKFTAGDRGLAVVDIPRVEHCKIAEHWDVAQPLAEKSVNSNGMF